jgi:putative oxidoreductase
MNLASIGRYIYALPFGIFGILHLLGPEQLVGVIPKFLPAPTLWVYAAGLSMILACISIVIQKQTRLACILLAVLMGLYIVLIHIPSMGRDSYAMVNLLKDLAFIGASLYIGAHYQK